MKDYGFRWSDFDDMTQTDLEDIVNAKAQLKKKKKTTKVQETNPENSMEQVLRQAGLL